MFYVLLSVAAATAVTDVFYGRKIPNWLIVTGGVAVAVGLWLDGLEPLTHGVIRMGATLAVALIIWSPIQQAGFRGGDVKVILLLVAGLGWLDAAILTIVASILSLSYPITVVVKEKQLGQWIRTLYFNVGAVVAGKPRLAVDMPMLTKYSGLQIPWAAFLFLAFVLKALADGLGVFPL